MKKGIKTPTIVTTAILTVITVFVWITFEIYRSITAKPAPPVPPEIITPLNPTLDVAMLNKLQQRMHLSENQIGNFTVTGTAFTTPLPVSSPSASPQTQPQETPGSTGSAIPASP